MAGGKHAREGNSEPSCKRTAIDLELKLRMIRKYEGGQSLSAIARELVLAVSTVNTIVKDAFRIKERVKVTACLSSITIYLICLFFSITGLFFAYVFVIYAMLNGWGGEEI
jgi:hypothetical protein